MKKCILPVIIIVIVISILMGFIEKDNNKINQDDANKTINYGINNIPNDLKNVGSLSKREQDILCAVSKGLVSKNQNDEIEMEIASEVTQSDDGIQYNFKIRDNVYWSDGSRITADDIVEFFKELLREEDKEIISAILNVYGAENFKEDKSTFENGVAIKSYDDNLVIRLNKKDDNFLEELTKPQYRIRKYMVLWSNIKNNYSKLIYSGDYKISSANDKSITLERTKASDDDIKDIKILEDDTVELSMAAFEVKQRDIVIDPPESELNKLKDQGKLITLPKADSTYLVINDGKNGIDIQGRKFIYNSICKGIETYQAGNSNEFEPAEGSYFREDKEDLAKLQSRKVISNKNTSWDKPEVLTLLGKDNEENRILCRILKTWFKDNEGISMVYSLVKESEFNDTELQKRYDMVLVNNKADKDNKQEFYFNFESFLNSKDKDILQKTIGNDNKEELYSSLESNLFNEYRILPLIFYYENIALSDSISNLNLDGNENLDFSTMD